MAASSSDQSVQTSSSNARREWAPSAVAIKLQIDVSDVDDVAGLHSATRMGRVCFDLAPSIVCVFSVQFARVHEVVTITSEK
jgi:hypothetical protein